MAAEPRQTPPDPLSAKAMTEPQANPAVGQAARRTDRARPLSPGQVLDYVARQWMRRPGRFAAISALMLAGTLCDLAIPWAAGGLIEAVSRPARVDGAAWRAWALLSGLYLGFYLL